MTFSMNPGKSKITPKNKTFPYVFFILASPLILWFPLAPRLALAAEPMMDESVLTTTLVGISGGVKAGKFRQALQAEENVLLITQNKNGLLHPALAPILNDLGTLHRYLAEYVEAEQAYKWSLALLEKNLGPDTVEVAETLDKLASLYLDLNRLQEAELLINRSIGILKSNKRNNNKTQIQALELSGQIELGLLQSSKAQALFRQAFDLASEKYPADFHLSIRLRNEMAISFLKEGSLEKAQDCLEKNLTAAQRNFPGDSEESADALKNLADYFHSQNLTEKAKPLYETALSIAKRLTGDNSDYSSIPRMKALASLYSATENPLEAETFWLKSLNMEKEFFGKKHPLVALDLIQLAEVDSTLGKKAFSRNCLVESRDILKLYFASDHPLLLLVNGLLEKPILKK